MNNFSVDEPFSLEFILENIFRPIDKIGFRVTLMNVNTTDFYDIRRMGRDVLDINTDAPSLKKGHVGVIWGIDLYTNRFTSKHHPHLKMKNKYSDRTREDSWCPFRKKFFRTPFCNDPTCLIRQVHES